MWAQAPHTQQAQLEQHCCLAYMPWRTESALPLRVHPIALLLTMPELLNLSVPRAPRNARAVQRALQVFLASARIEADGGPADAMREEEAPTAPRASTQVLTAQGQRASTHTPPVRSAHKAASRPHHAPVGRSHPPLEATVSPVPAAVGRSSTGAPLPLIHDRPASRGTVRPHTCAGPKPVTCSHNPTLPPSPPRRPTAAPFAARGPATHHVPAAPVAMSAAPATASAVVPLLRRVATCRVLCHLRAGGTASSLLLLARIARKRLHLVQCSSNRSVQQACGATLRRGHLGDRGLDHAIAVCGTV